MNKREKKVLLFGHRGAKGEAPENTFPAFRLAYEAGMDGIEIDVHLTKDGKVVCVHDSTLTRVSGMRARVRDYSYKELSRLDVGSYFSEKFKKERIPLLEEVLDEFKGKLIFDIELKSNRLNSGGLEEAVIGLVKKKGVFEETIFSSFNPLIIFKLKRIEPEIKTGLNYLGDFIENLRRVWFKPFLKPYSVHPEPSMIDDGFINYARRSGAKLIPWQVNEKDEILRVLEIGVDGIISDYPGLLKSIYDNWLKANENNL